MAKVDRTLLRIVSALSLLAGCTAGPGSKMAADRAGKRFDTILFQSPTLEERNCEALLLPAAEYRHGTLLLPTTGQGNSAWPDSLQFLRKGPDWLVAAGTMVADVPQLLYYRVGDSLRMFQVGNDEPVVRVLRNPRLEVIWVQDTAYGPDYIVKGHHFFALDSAGYLSKPYSLFPTRWRLPDGRYAPYEFVVDCFVKGDSVYVLADGKVERVWR